MTPPELVAAGYNVELGYKPYIPADELIDLQEQVPPESIDSYYTRNFFVTQCVLQKTEEIGGNLLFVGHAATLDACSRQLVDKEQVGFQFFNNFLLSLCVLLYFSYVFLSLPTNSRFSILS